MINPLVLMALLPALGWFQVAPNCELVEEGFGTTGQLPIRAEVVTDGLEVPWALAFVSKSDILVSERPGRIRLIRDGKLLEKPVATLQTGANGEGGLLGIAAHPQIEVNGLFYVYSTVENADGRFNQVDRYQLSADRLSARFDRRIISKIPGEVFHDGGRLRFGPDGMLYVGTGDAGTGSLSQDPQSLAGKILRVLPDGAIPATNPFPASPVFLLGIRNTQGFDWVNGDTLVVTDHGPTGEMGLSGLDEVSFVQAGQNLGWPTIHGCESKAGLVTPDLVWQEALPPGGAAIVRGNTIPEWKGDLLIASLRSMHLQRLDLDGSGGKRILSHEVYFEGDLPEGWGRLREVISAPDGYIYLTTSNCDGRGTCPPRKDAVLRIMKNG